MASGHGGHDFQRSDYKHLRTDAAHAKAAQPLVLRAISSQEEEQPDLRQCGCVLLRASIFLRFPLVVKHDADQ
jgi:hypothetical protein